MALKDTEAKLRGILEAIAAGRSCEQILAADSSLTYHDIFHAVAEAPTTFWRNNGGGKKGRRSRQPSKWIPTPVRSRVD